MNMTQNKGNSINTSKAHLNDQHVSNMKKLLLSGSAFRQGIEKEVRSELRDLGMLEDVEKEIDFRESMVEKIPAGYRVYSS